MGDFNKALRFVLNNEGGFANHPADKGGATKYGITHSTLSVAVAKGIVAECDIRDLSLEDAGKIYRARYYANTGCELLPWPLDAVHFDACVNHGVGAGVKLLQRTLNIMEHKELVVDGGFGIKTKAALKDSVLKLEANASYRATWQCAYCDFREALYKAIVRNNPKQAVFMRGWMNRVERNRRLV